MTTFLHMSLAGGIAICIVALTRYITRRHYGGAFGGYSGRAMKAVWLIVLARLLLPVTIETGLIPSPEILTMNASSEQVGDSDVGRHNQTIVYESDKMNQDRTAAADIPVLPLVWAVGCIGVAGFFTISYLRMRRDIVMTSPVSENVERRFAALAESLSVYRAVVYAADIAYPICVGFLRQRVLMPREYEALDREELDCVLCHELWHIKRHDNLYKLFICAAACLHWFNPAVWLMLVLANRDIELACDEAVLEKSNIEAKTYALCLIRAQELTLPTAVGFGGSAIDERIRSIMNKRKRFTLAGLILLALLIAASSMTFIGAAQPDSAAVERTVKPYRASDDADTQNIDETSTVYETESEPSDQVEAGSFEETVVIADFPDDNPNMQYTFPLVGGAELSCDYGTRQTPIGTTLFHSGIDLIADSGDDILAAISGKVTSTGFDDDKGNYIVIANDEGLEIEYNHCKEVYVESGDTVDAGQVVAAVGSTGSATGAHLHFEVREDGFTIDPKLYFGFGIN